MARLALAAGSQDGTEPPHEKVYLDVVGWASKEDPKPESERIPVAYTVHKDWRGPIIDGWLGYGVCDHHGRIIRDYPAQFPYRLALLPIAGGLQKQPFVSLPFEARHRLVFLMEKATDGLLLEENGIVEYARLFREIHRRFFPPARNPADEIGNVTYLNRREGPAI